MAAEAATTATFELPTSSTPWPSSDSKPLRNEPARRVLAEQRAGFEGQMRDAIGDVVRRLGRTPAIPIEQLSETAVALYLHSLAQEGLGQGGLDPQQLVETVLPGVIMGLSRESD